MMEGTIFQSKSLSMCLCSLTLISYSLSNVGNKLSHAISLSVAAAYKLAFSSLASLTALLPPDYKYRFFVLWHHARRMLIIPVLCVCRSGSVPRHVSAAALGQALHGISQFMCEDILPKT